MSESEGLRAGADLVTNRRFAEYVVARAQPLIDDPDLGARAADVLRAAQELTPACELVVTIGLFGEYNTGKSLTLGTLLGDPLLLPVSSEPATANITRVRLSAAGDAPKACVTGAAVRFLDGDEVSGYLAAVLTQAADQLIKVNAPSEAVARIRYLPIEPGALLEVAKAIDVNDTTRSLAAHAAEARALYQALMNDPPLGAVVPLANADLTALVLHGAAPTPKSTQLIPHRPLVAEVTVDVTVPDWAWDLSELGGAQVHLVDVPGVGSLSFRDGYLSEREIDRVTAVLAVVKATRANARDSWKSVDDLAAGGRTDALRRRLLVAATHFDSLQGVPGNLLDDAGRSLLAPAETEAELLARPEMRSVRALAEQIRARVAAPDRFAFVSPLVALARVDGTGDEGWDPAAVRTALELSERDVAAAGAVADDWRAARPPAGPIGGALDEFSRDGGIRHLRRMIVRYVQADGVNSHVADVRDRAARLQREYDGLLADVDTLAATKSPAMLAERDLRDAILRVGRLAATMSGRLGRELSHPRLVEIDEELSLYDEIEQRAANLVFDWPQWKLLLSAVRDGLVVVAPRREGAARSAPTRREPVTAAVAPAGGPWSDEDWDNWNPDDTDEDEEGLDDIPPPILAEEFVAPFAESCAALRAEIADQVVAAVTAWQRRQVTAVVADRTTVRRLMGGAARVDRSSAARLMNVLERITSEKRFGDKVREFTNEKELPETPATAFPLDPTRALPWHPESPRRRQVDRSGPIHVLRLRRTMTDALTAEGNRHAHRLLAATVEGVDKLFKDADTKSRDPRLIDNAIADARAAAGTTWGVHA